MHGPICSNINPLGRKQLSHLVMKTPITGIKRSSQGYKIKDKHTDILLCVSNMWDEVKISMLSEEDIEEV